MSKPAQLSHSQIHSLMSKVERLDKAYTAVNNMVKEEEAAELLGCSVKHLQNKVYKGELKGMYTVSPVNGKRFYHRDKIQGL